MTPALHPITGTGATEGPWAVMGDGVTVAQNRKEHRTHVCRAFEIYGLRAEREANARLIAAAPSLRDALINAVALLDALLKHDDEVALGVITAARSALLRAQAVDTGEGRT